MTDKEIDQRLHDALTPDVPEDRLFVFKEMTKESEGTTMKMKRLSMVACLCLGLILVSGTAYAAYKYLSPERVAEQVNETKLAKYFGKTENEVVVQEKGDYRAVYIGKVTGKDLSEGNDIPVDKNYTYIVTALERTDGQPITIDDSFVTSPFVHGVRPWQYNIFFMDDSGATSFVKNNTLYSLTRANDIEQFADRGAYIAITDRPPSAESYAYDETTGDISSVENYSGINFLFKADLDKSKADPEKAEELLRDAGVTEEK